MTDRQKLYTALSELIPMISSFKECEERNRLKPASIDVRDPNVAEETTQENCRPLQNDVYNYVEKLDEDTLRGIQTIYINCRTVRESDDNPIPTEEDYQDPDFVQRDKNKYILEDDYNEFKNSQGVGLLADVKSYCFRSFSEEVFQDGIQKYNLFPSF